MKKFSIINVYVCSLNVIHFIYYVQLLTSFCFNIMSHKNLENLEKSRKYFLYCKFTKPKSIIAKDIQ